MNERDSESIEATLLAYDHVKAVSEKEADLIIVNTCSVRQKAEAKALGKLGLLLKGAEGMGKIIGVTGCMVQNLKDDVFKKAQGLSFALGPASGFRIIEVISRSLNGEKNILVLDDGETYEQTGHIPGQLSAYINILFGCDRKCSYCIVPSVRGSEWSRPAQDILKEAKDLVESGVKEVILLGQSVMQYGKRNEVLEPSMRSPLGLTEPFSRLLEAVCAIPGIKRVRFASSHPSGCTEELAKVYANYRSLCGHLHLPLQSGSDSVLRAMKRGYSTREYIEAVSRLRKARPGLALTTDIIVGYPGETQEDFDLTRSFMEEMEFDNAFIFKYSPRPGTAAALLEDDVTADEKMRRNRLLLEDQDKRGRLLNERLLGVSLDVMVEGPSLRNAQKWSGRSESNKIVIFDRENNVQRGDIITVVIDRVMPQTLYGKIERIS